MIRSDQKLTFLYIWSDFLILFSVFTGCHWYYTDKPMHNHDYLNLVVFTLVWLTSGSFHRLYLLHLHNNFLYRFVTNLKSQFGFVGALSLIYIFFGIPEYTRIHFITFLFSFFLGNIVVAFILFKLVGALRVKGMNVRKTLIVGAGRIGSHITDYFNANQDFGYSIIGFLDDSPDEHHKSQTLGGIEDITNILTERKVDEIIIALPTNLREKIKYVIETADYFGIRVRVVPDYHGLLDRNYKLSHFGDMPVINVREISLDKFYSAFLKRLFDIAFSFILLVVLSPLLLVVTAAIVIDSRGPVFYCPVRLGKNGRKFKIFKFRSMYQNDNAGTLSTSKNDARITRVGAFIRKYSLDELPQFINVLFGDMSVVGPRPHRLHLNKVMQEQVEKYMIRHYLKPGITGWAQVNGWRGPTDTHEQRSKRTAHDLWYMENWTLFLDMKIIYLTVFSEKTHKAAF